MPRAEPTSDAYDVVVRIGNPDSVYDLDLYGAHVAVDFAARLRDTERFDSAAALAEQMRRDVDQARAITADQPG